MKTFIFQLYKPGTDLRAIVICDCKDYSQAWDDARRVARVTGWNIATDPAYQVEEIHYNLLHLSNVVETEAGEPPKK